MKKIIITSALVAVAAAVTAQTVTSANIVGYNKDVGVAGAFHISGYAFLGSDTTPEGVFGAQLPLGTKLYVFNGTNYDISTYSSVFDYGTYTFIDKWDPNTLDLSGAAGFWVENVGNDTAVLSGEVEMADSVTNSIAVGFQLMSNPYPVASIVKDMDFSPTLGDKIYKFNGTNYDISTYSSVFDYGTYTFVDKWDPETLPIGIGEGFWYEAVSAQTWIANKPF